MIEAARMAAFNKRRDPKKRPQCCRERNGSFSKILARTGQSGNGPEAAPGGNIRLHGKFLDTNSWPGMTYFGWKADRLEQKN